MAADRAYRDFGEKLEAYAEVGVSHSLIRLTRLFPIEVDPSQLLSRRRA